MYWTHQKSIAHQLQDDRRGGSQRPIPHRVVRCQICCRPALKASIYNPHLLTKYRLDCDEYGYEEEDGGIENRKEAFGTGGLDASVKEGLHGLAIQHQFNTFNLHIHISMRGDQHKDKGTQKTLKW